MIFFLLVCFLQAAAVMLKAGADPCQQDCHGNNIIHVLILQAFLHTDIMDNVSRNLSTFLSLITDDQLGALLKTENKYGLFPLEFAAQHGLAGIYTILMETPTYKIKEEKKGLITRIWYDITDYEGNGNRRHFSPLRMFVFEDRRMLAESNFNSILETNELMVQWSQAKFRNDLHVIILLFFTRILYLTCYFVYDIDTSFMGDYDPDNTTHFCRKRSAVVLNSNVRTGFGIYLIVHSSATIIADVTEILRSFTHKEWPMWSTVTGKKELVVQVSVYRFNNLMFAVFVLVFITISFYALDEQDIFILNVFRMVCPVLSAWSILFFMQMLPSIGHFVIGIQLIVKDMVHFVIVYTLMFQPFAHTFHIFINTNTNEGCIDAFSTLISSNYSLFMVMLNMIDLRMLDIRNKAVLLVAHMVFTFLISIMMINFFIALLSNSVNAVNSHSNKAIMRQRLAVSFLVESRLFCICGPLYRRWQHLTVQDDRVFLVHTKYDFMSDVIQEK